MRNGWVQGFRDGTFRPDQMVTASEVAAVFVQVAGIPHRDSNHMVGKEAWYQRFMDAMRSVDREFTMHAWDAITGAHLKHELCVLRGMAPVDPLEEFGGSC